MSVARTALLALGFLACGYESDGGFGNSQATPGGLGPGGVPLPGAPGSSSGTGGERDAGPTCGAAPLPLCADGAACAQNTECSSAHCVQNACVPPAADDKIKNGTETDVDCGGGGAPCTVGQACVVGTDCDQKVCSPGNLCQPPTPTDLVQNGTETDVDCGGVDGALPCAVNQACLLQADCASHGCDYLHKCIERPSCVQHEGGDTCGAGEVDDPARVHESCCVDLPLPGAATHLDKYVVTAGRMRAFIEFTQGNVAGWIAEHPPTWWDAEYGGVAMPNNVLEANFELSADGASGECNIGDDENGSGVRTYWLPDADNVAFGSGHQGYPQSVLDTKALNCVRRPMIAALCAFDGKRVPTFAEYREAWGGVGRKYPWGEAAWNSELAVHNRTYFYPDPLPAFVADQAYHMAAPGRRPLGNGPLGHADLAGLLFEHGAGDSTIAKGSFENHAIDPNAAGTSFTITRKYGAIGGRCARD